MVAAGLAHVAEHRTDRPTVFELRWPRLIRTILDTFVASNRSHPLSLNFRSKTTSKFYGCTGMIFQEKHQPQVGPVGARENFVIFQKSKFPTFSSFAECFWLENRFTLKAAIQR